jgi:hypothetical protein
MHSAAAVSPHQKCKAVLCMLAYDSVVDSIDEYIRMGKGSVLGSASKYSIEVCFSDEYNHRPSVDDQGNC